MVHLLPTATVPETIFRQLSDLLMVYVPVLVRNLICVSFNPMTVPVSVLFPGEGVGRLGRRGLGVGLTASSSSSRGVVVVAWAQLTRSATLARMQI